MTFQILHLWLVEKVEEATQGRWHETKCEQKRFSNFHHVPRVFYSFLMFSHPFRQAYVYKPTASVLRCEKTPTSWLSPKERLLDIQFLGGNLLFGVCFG